MVLKITLPKARNIYIAITKSENFSELHKEARYDLKTIKL